MGKFDKQLAHWREQYRGAVEDLQDLDSGRRRWRKTLARAGLIPLTAGGTELGPKLCSLHSWSKSMRSSTPEMFQAGSPTLGGPLHPLQLLSSS